jgi:acetolactate synthase I/II/III large subunit
MQQQSAPAGVTANGARGKRRSSAEFGSDVIVELLQDLGIEYIALNPGASYRGLHDSLVNFGISPAPQIVLCCHENIAVAVAGGYARVTGKPMAVGLHNVVGLQNGSMGIYCAYCDRAPMLVLGGTGPMDTTKRRPHIDWIHTALVQGNQVREYVKWDDQPASVDAVPESVLRAYRIAMTEPHGPVYLCFDTELQEQPVSNPPQIPDVERFAPALAPAANPKGLRRAAELLCGARWPVIIPDTTGRHHEALPALKELAELLGCAVVDRGEFFNFPSNHSLDLTLVQEEAVGEADVLLALDVVDLGGVTSAARDRGGDTSTLDTPAKVIHISLGDLLYSSWTGDYERLHPVDVSIAANTAEALPELVALCRAELQSDPAAADRIEQRRRRVEQMHDEARSKALEPLAGDADLRPISAYRLYSELWKLIKDRPWNLATATGRVPLRAMWDITEPDQRSEVGRGAGIGYEAAAALGTALAYKDTDRLCISIAGDGGFLMVPQLLWTAANSRIPILYVMFDNRSYYNDERHQELVARARGRSIENKGIGIRLEEPETDFAGLARSFGVRGFGPVSDPDELSKVLAEAIHVVRDERRPALVDVLTQAY